MATDLESFRVEIRAVLVEFRRNREFRRLALLMEHMDALIDELMDFGKRAIKKHQVLVSDSGQVGNRDSIFYSGLTKGFAALRACGFEPHEV
jgi:hypothetical protein